MAHFEEKNQLLGVGDCTIPEIGKRTLVLSPVVEQALKQLETAQVLDFSRASAIDPSQGTKQRRKDIDSLRAYASLLGDDRAEQVATGFEARLTEMQSDKRAAKSQVYAAFASMRSMKDFDD